VREYARLQHALILGIGHRPTVLQPLHNCVKVSPPHALVPHLLVSEFGCCACLADTSVAAHFGWEGDGKGEAECMENEVNVMFGYAGRGWAALGDAAGMKGKGNVKLMRPGDFGRPCIPGCYVTRRGNSG